MIDFAKYIDAYDNYQRDRISLQANLVGVRGWHFYVSGFTSRIDIFLKNDTWISTGWKELLFLSELRDRLVANYTNCFDDGDVKCNG